jgi:spore coat polysaccharide biosynthesis predicted glycosyltransferase SpsG
MRSIVIRCDGGATTGLGHVVRSLALAAELRDAHGCAIAFAMREPSGVGAAAVRAAGYAIDVINTDDRLDYPDALGSITASRKADVLIVDVRDALSRASLDGLRRTSAHPVRIVTIDDISERCLAADLAFFPPVPQVEAIDWSGFTGRRYAGWEWVILKKEFEAGRASGADGSGGAGESGESGESGGEESPAIDVLVTMGGSDAAGMTAFTLQALELLPMPLSVLVVVGPAFSHALELIDAAARSRHSVQIARTPVSMAALMRGSRVAVTSFGVSAYELAACGVPAIHLCLTSDHARSSSAFVDGRIAITAGVFGRVSPGQIADAVTRLMGNAGRRGEMAVRARRLIDGRGAQRVAAEIVSRLLQ